MALAIDRAVMPDNALRNYLRGVPPGVVLYYPGLNGGGTTVVDYSGKVNKGTITGATWVRLPSGLWCLSFDGTDDVVNCGSGATIDALTGPMAIEAWINPVSEGETLGRIADLNTIEFAVNANQTAYFNVVVGGANKSAQAPNGSVPFGSWSHLVGLFGGANVIIIVNDVVTVGAATAGPIDAHAADNFLIGDRSASDRCFNGKIALMRVYGAAPATSLFSYHRAQERRYFGV